MLRGERGREAPDLPDFLDRAQGLAEDEEHGGGADIALQNLDRLADARRTLRSPLLCGVFDSLLAQGHGRVGNVAKMLELTEASTATDSDLDVWRTLYLALALEQDVPARASELRLRLESQLDDLDRDTQSAIQEQLEIHQRRSEIDNPASFLAAENRSRSYPSGGLHGMGVLYDLAIELRDHLRDGDEVKSVRVAQAMMTIEDNDDYDDCVKLPQFVEELVAGIGRFKWGDRGSGLLPVFERFAESAPNLLSRTDPFYLCLLHTNLAIGLVSIENPAAAGRHVNRAIRAIAATKTELDFADGCAAVMGVIEQFPLRARADLIERLLTYFADLFDNEQSHYLKQGRLFAVLVRLMQQFVEASISRDRISLNQFKNYQLQDEFLILRRIQRETFCA